MDTENSATNDSQMHWDHEAFAERLKSVKGYQSTNAFARRCGISESVFRKYLAGVSVPGADKLVDIARVAGVSLVWLATGTGSAQGSEPDAFKQAAGIDETLLEAIIDSVDGGLRELGGELPPAKKAKLVATIYRIYQSGGEAPRAPVLELVKLAM
ncbi:MAG: helix-turn-helix transcriptional regulator [Chromatiaceae bacterium]